MSAGIASFEFATAPKVIFGSGSLKQTGPASRHLGTRGFIVCGHRQKLAQELKSSLAPEGFSLDVISISGEPTTDQIESVVERVRSAKAEVLFAVGGGGAMDSAKAIAAMAGNTGTLLDYLEVVGLGKPLPCPALPVVAIPTTAGTGAEVTRNAVLHSPSHHVKASLRHASMMPRLAIVDPLLTLDLPPAITAATGMDALTQLIEPYVSIKANPMSDALAREGLAHAASSLAKAFQKPDDVAAREHMSVASLFSGMALANSGLGAVHGIAAPLGGAFGAPHGAICAALLPHAMTVNIAAMRSRQPQHEALRRYDEIARILTGRTSAKADDGVQWILELVRSMSIPSLAHYGIAANHVADLAAKAASASSMRGNPIQLQPGEIEDILNRAL